MPQRLLATSPQVSDSPPKPEELDEGDLLGVLNRQAQDATNLIYSIKNYLYQLLKIRVNIAAPENKSYNTLASVVRINKKNIKDLSRIESILKGCKGGEMSTLYDDQPNQLLGSQSLLAAQSERVEHINLSSEPATKMPTNKSIQQRVQASKQAQSAHELELLKLQNQRLLAEVQMLKSSQNVKIPGAIGSKSRKESEPAQAHRLINKSKQQSSLNRSKSQIEGANLNLSQVRKRNIECLSLIKSIKKQIGLSINNQDP